MITIKYILPDELPRLPDVKVQVCFGPDNAALPRPLTFVESSRTVLCGSHSIISHAPATIDDVADRATGNDREILVVGVVNAGHARRVREKEVALE